MGTGPNSASVDSKRNLCQVSYNRNFFIYYKTIYCSWYIDEIFMTTNESIEQMQFLLGRENNKDKDIKINFEIATSVNFLDLAVENFKSALKTQLFHKPAARPYILPFDSLHQKHIYRNIPFAELFRAARVSSDVDLFDREQIDIIVTLLLKDYPPDFIRYHMKRFFRLHDATAVTKKADPTAHQQLHRKLLNLPTRREQNLIEQIKDAQRSPITLQQKHWNSKVM